MITARTNQVDTFPNVSTISDRMIREALLQLRGESLRTLQRINALEKLSQVPEKDRTPDPVLNSFVELNIGPGDTVSGFIRLRAGKGSPEGIVTGSAGRDAWFRTDGAAASFIYLKETGQGNTGWVPVATTSTSAVNDATYITLTNNATLTDERVLTGTSNQIVLTDNGAGATVVISLPASPDVTTSYKVANTKVVGTQGAVVADAAGGATIDAEARTAINTLLARARAHGLIAT